MTRMFAWPTVAALAAAVVLVAVGPRPNVARAQHGAPRTTTEAIEQMSFLVGTWQGDGWIEFAPGQRLAFVETETVVPKLDGLALLIEGHGTQPPPADAMVVHAALAVLTYDADDQRYDFRAYQGSRGTTSAVDAEASLVDGVLVWGFKPDPEASSSIRYTISVSDAGEWVEVGELTPDGQTWRTFFQMTLAHQPQDETAR